MFFSISITKVCISRQQQPHWFCNKSVTLLSAKRLRLAAAVWLDFE
jgi:hypothetical protein